MPRLTNRGKTLTKRILDGQRAHNLKLKLRVLSKEKNITLSEDVISELCKTAAGLFPDNDLLSVSKAAAELLSGYTDKSSSTEAATQLPGSKVSLFSVAKAVKASIKCKKLLNQRSFLAKIKNTTRYSITGAAQIKLRRKRISSVTGTFVLKRANSSSVSKVQNIKHRVNGLSSSIALQKTSLSSGNETENIKPTINGSFVNVTADIKPEDSSSISEAQNRPTMSGSSSVNVGPHFTPAKSSSLFGGEQNIKPGIRSISAVNGEAKRRKLINDFDSSLFSDFFNSNLYCYDTLVKIDGKLLNDFLNSSVWCSQCNLRQCYTDWRTDELKVLCGNCKNEVYSVRKHRITTIGENTKQDVTRLNLQTVKGILDSDMDYTQSSRFLRSLSIAVPSMETLNKYLLSMNETSHKEINIHFDKVAEIVKNYYKEHFNNKYQDGQNTHIAVWHDGTVTTKGSTHIGIGFVVELYTGLIIDLEILGESQCCSCLKDTESEHLVSNVSEQSPQNVKDLSKMNQCPHNVTDNTEMGQSKQNVADPYKIKLDIALRLFKRSTERCLLYTTFVSNKKSKLFQDLEKEKPYGETEIREENCRNVFTNCLKVKLLAVAAEHNFESTLTEANVQMLCDVYNKACMNECKVKGQRSCLASLYHSMSDRYQNFHDYCDDFCFFKQKPIGTTNKTNWKKLHCHENMDLKLTVDHVKVLMPVYEELLTLPVLRQCSSKFNHIENLQNDVRQRCTFNDLFSIDKVRYVTYQVAFSHNLSLELDSTITDTVKLPLLKVHKAKLLKLIPKAKSSKRKRHPEPVQSKKFFAKTFPMFHAV